MCSHGYILNDCLLIELLFLGIHVSISHMQHGFYKLIHIKIILNTAEIEP